MVSIALLQLIEDEDEENFMFLLFASAILSELESRMMRRPTRNLVRNNELDADSDYENN